MREKLHYIRVDREQKSGRGQKITKTVSSKKNFSVVFGEDDVFFSSSLSIIIMIIFFRIPQQESIIIDGSRNKTIIASFSSSVVLKFRIDPPLNEQVQLYPQLDRKTNPTTDHRRRSKNKSGEKENSMKIEIWSFVHERLRSLVILTSALLYVFPLNSFSRCSARVKIFYGLLSPAAPKYMSRSIWSRLEKEERFFSPTSKESLFRTKQQSLEFKM